MSADLFDLSSYDYELPEKLIAQYPLKRRDQARLLVIDRRLRKITHDTFANIGAWLPPKSMLVVNNSKVIAARLLGKKETGGEVEVFLLNRYGGDPRDFQALLRPLKKVREGQVIDFGKGLQAVLVDKDQRVVRFNTPDALRAIEVQGHIPLPPYIKREDALSDRREYQTVYAKHLGSVAAPTAGLHFTRTLMRRLKAAGHDFSSVTLHINYGTFKPVETEDIRRHLMHEETYDVSEAEYARIREAKEKSGSVVVVGTTACRTLESITAGGPLSGSTNIFIYPGHHFKAVDCLITNFHLPKSTLLMLVCAFGGHDLVMRAYREAIIHGYRFYSYGDAMLVF